MDAAGITSRQRFTIVIVRRTESFKLLYGLKKVVVTINPPSCRVTLPVMGPDSWKWGWLAGVISVEQSMNHEGSEAREGEVGLASGLASGTVARTV